MKDETCKYHQLTPLYTQTRKSWKQIVIKSENQSSVEDESLKVSTWIQIIMFHILRTCQNQNMSLCQSYEILQFCWPDIFQCPVSLAESSGVSAAEVWSVRILVCDADDRLR